MIHDNTAASKGIRGKKFVFDKELVCDNETLIGLDVDPQKDHVNNFCRFYLKSWIFALERVISVAMKKNPLVVEVTMITIQRGYLRYTGNL